MPVSLTSRDLRDRLAQALVRANGRQLDSFDKAVGFLEHELDFYVTHTFGGHSSCVEFEAESEHYFVCDMGSGARPFGAHVLARQSGRPAVVNVFMSHMHWDHIMGFPFFAPAYVPGNRIRIYGCHANLEEALRRQQDPPSFPVPFDRLGASIEFVTLQPGRSYEIAGWSVTAKLQSHSGDSYGYRFVRDGRIIVYSTDSEHRLDVPHAVESAATFFADADLVIFDAMYSLAEAVSVKEDWGHSSNVVGVELCQLANVKHLVLFHHEPANNDERIAQIWRETLRYEEISRTGEPLRISVAYDGLEIEL
jgi:phosphoribosyl 1,2-cyclic phosphodiesterase